MAISDDLEKLAERLRQERDELRLKIHLGTREVQDEWRELEEKWAPLEKRLDDVKEDVADAARELGSGMDVVTEEISEAYRRIRKRLSD